ncbi:MAG: DUF4286 family protein [Bacteroidaceae bacterium]|nr:DUF4286 family protein [Bacteroidaceae bacterium]
MLVFNTTYTIPNEEARNFVIWIHQVFIPKATASGQLSKHRLLRVLSHKDEATECFSLQFEVEDSSVLHNWYTQCGSKLNEEMLKLFEDRVVGFSTILEEIEG